MEHAMDLRTVRSYLVEAMELRKKYVPSKVDAADIPAKAGEELRFEFKDGIVKVTRASDGTQFGPFFPGVKEYYDDMSRLFHLRNDGAVNTFCYHRLKILQMKYEVHAMVHFDKEADQQHGTPHRDFYNVRKVDTHIHHSASMNAKHLLRFIKKKLKRFPDDIVQHENGRPVTLREVFERLNITWGDLSLDRLNVLADKTTMHRFDRFNDKYSPLGDAALRTIFLKTDNQIGGRYLAEITRELLDDLEESKYQHTEWRLSIYGRKRNEWGKLARWVIGHKLVSENNQWMIQIPRLYSVFKAAGQIDCFQDLLDNLFLPLFEVSLSPEKDPELHEFLKMVSGFDSVDDESKSEVPIQRNFSSKARTPAGWDIVDNPSYKYYNFYIQSNIRILNYVRASRGLSQFDFRPHAGEAGEVHHLDTAFLLADGINHGINLRKSMGLQYLFYLCQVGLAISPASNNQLFLAYDKNPFPDFFKRGLNVSLSTDDPLMFHFTKEPLMEEFSIARQIWKLNSADMCEIARNSVLQSGFPDKVKEHWLGTPNFTFQNVIAATNVPDLRVKFRQECLQSEMKLLRSGEDSGFEAVAWTHETPKHEPRETDGAMSPFCVPLPVALPEGEALEQLPSFVQAEEQRSQKDEEAVRRLMRERSDPHCDYAGARAVALSAKSGAGGSSGATGLALPPAKRPRTASRDSLNESARPRAASWDSQHESARPRAASWDSQHESVEPVRAAHETAAKPADVVMALGEVGLLSKLLAEYDYGVVQDVCALLCRLQRDPDFDPTLDQQVEAAWKFAVLNTREYHEVCRRCFGRTIHHSTVPSSAAEA